MAAVLLFLLIGMSSCFTCPALNFTIYLDTSDSISDWTDSNVGNLQSAYYTLEDPNAYSFDYVLGDVGIGFHLKSDEILDTRGFLVYYVDPDGSGTDPA